jgi:hypothetical protein
MADKTEIVEAHLRRFFSGHAVTMEQWIEGPRHHEMPSFQVLRIAPGPRSELWSYASLGAVDLSPSGDSFLEFILCSVHPDERLLHLVTMVAWYHMTRDLGLGHTMPIGEPWLPGSHCDYFLISKPYPFGPELEICNFDNAHAHVLWLLPITKAERDFKVEHGLEALERKLDDAAIRFWDVERKSVV